MPTDFDIVPETGDLELALTPPVPAERLSSPEQALPQPPAPAVRDVRPSADHNGSVERVAASPVHREGNRDRLVASNHVTTVPHPPPAANRVNKTSPQREAKKEGETVGQTEPESPMKLAPEPEPEPEMEPTWERKPEQNSEREPEPEPEPEAGLGLELEPEQKAEMRPVVEAVSSVVVNATPSKTQVGFRLSTAELILTRGVMFRRRDSHMNLLRVVTHVIVLSCYHA